MVVTIPNKSDKQLSLNLILIVLAQIYDTPFKVKLKAVNKVLKDNGGDKIDYFYKPQLQVLIFFYFLLIIIFSLLLSLLFFNML